MMINLDTGVCISVRDSCLFYNLNQENCRRLVAGGSLQSFYILVSSCEKRKENMRRLRQSIQPQTSAACVYKETDYFKNLIHMPPPAQHPRRRHVEISSTEQKPKDLEGILEITESLSVKDNDWLSCLDDLHQTFPRLKDVAVERCQRMNQTFSTAWYGEDNVASELLSIRAGHLSQLTTIFYIYSQHEKYFAALKHLYVYNCGNLKSIFTERLLLPNLETLIITYCGKLQTVFDKSSMKPDDIENKLQNLRKIRFEELPQMRHIYDCDKHRVGPLHAPQWKTLYFRGCWSLCRLPFLEGPRDQEVCVDGEVSQCKKIKMQMKAEELFHYKFKSPPHVASKKSINNRIFLK
ncbi:hypothetical protein LUZ62_082943 [Rhynchospora pubera]|uniref:Disease resistance protein At4g27190-like leucine-rich repeats domain-containing protein n=1 Tax=Rhynchospora pubera TaxID=906938 RepID=A0AAV8C3C6_9POAL|nr:hypothetical protein LUZ62_082943 [Rhynchospora pubera]